MKILYLIDSFDCDGIGRQLQLLGPRLNQTDGVEVCCVGSWSPELDGLRRAGVIVHALEWTRWVDASVLLNLRALVNEAAPDVIHVWRLAPLRALALVANGMLRRVVVSASLPAPDQLAWWDRWLLRQVRCVAFGGESDQALFAKQDIRLPRLHIVAPAIESNDAIADARSTGAANIVYLGRLDRTHGARHAVWAFDILRHLFPNTRLQMAGPETASTEIHALADGLQVTAQVDFLGVRTDRANLLRAASVVWLPRLANDGREAALDAMAHGRVVVGSDVPCLREVIRDRETGFLVPGGNAMEIARRTRLLLQDALLRNRMEQAARQMVERQFPLADTVAQWRELYRSVAA